MPITEAEISKADMEQAVRDGEVCGQCGGRLNVAWIGGGYVLRCGDLSHNTLSRHRRKSDYEKENEDAFRRVNKMDTKNLTMMDEKQMVARIEMAKFPQELVPAEKRLLAQVAISYGFDPLMGEVSIYQGRPYVSIDGRYRAAQETGKLDGVECRPANKKERDDWGIPDGDYFFRAEVRVKDASYPFVGWGRVYAAETIGKGFKPVEKNPQRMAEKRAEAQALRKAFHIPLPSVEDIGSPEENHVVKVNVVTGEIIEGKPPKAPDAAQERQETAGQAKAEGIPTEVLFPPEEKKKLEEPVEFPHIGALLKWCAERGVSRDKFKEINGITKETDLPKVNLAEAHQLVVDWLKEQGKAK